MKDKLKKTGHRAKDFIKKFAKGTKHYFKHNVLFITFVLTAFIEACMLRFFTVKNFTAISPLFSDFAVVLFVGAFAYFFKQKNRYKYLMTWSIIFTLVCVINSAYYTNYTSFTSFSLLLR